jgi:hypothetical protein
LAPNRVGELRQACLGLPNLQLIAAKYPHDRDSNIGAHVRETPMSKRVILCVPTVAVGLFATAIMLGTNYAAHAAGDCLAGPSRPPAQGGHWYYRFDQANNRKCWYLVEPAAPMPTAQAPEPQPSPDPTPQPTPQPTLSSFFSSLTAGFPGPPSGAQPDASTGDARIVQTPHSDDLKNNEAGSGRQPRMVLASKQHRPAHLRPAAEHTDEQPAQPHNQAERDTLFQEFLRWKDRQ